MKKFKLVAFIMILSFVISISVFAEVVKYDFDEVNVIYAAEYTVYPVNISEENWLTKIAGGIDKPVTVLYGIVELKKDGIATIGEEFIKLSGENGTERFLLNSASFSGVRKSFFWSAKKLVDNAVVKDFTGQIKSVTLYMINDNRIILEASDDGETHGQNFWSEELPYSYYEADMATMIQSGKR